MSEDQSIDAEIVRDESPPADDSEQARSPGVQLAVPSDLFPTTLYLLPLSERPFFPAQALPLLLNEDPWLKTVKLAERTEQKVLGLVLVRPDSTDSLTNDDFHQLGTLVRMHRLNIADGRIQFIAEGLRRFRIREWISTRPPYLARVDYPASLPGGEPDEVRAYAMAIINTIKELLAINPLYSEELRQFFNRFHPNDPSPLTDFAAALTTASKEQLQAVLDEVELLPRMKRAIVLVRKEVEVARLQGQIHEQVEQKMSEQQRKFFLREQLKIIQQELGIAKDDKTADIERFRERLQPLVLSVQAEKRIDDELTKLSVLETGSPEYGVTRSYLDVITSLPWGVHSADQLNLERARRILDRDHEGLEDVKDRIIEFLAVGALRGEVGGSILLLVGPPGVGKTSIGRSIADALKRRFYRFSVGGMRDEAEIKGHRRTYIGAMPGKFIQALQEVEVANPVLMIDEIDKVGNSYHGDPASALLEVLDPEQNRDFLDHYLDVRFDLSAALFICTANQLDTVPRALLDRMEVIRLAGYITAEKIDIARKHLWPRLLKRSGIARGQLRISRAALREIIEGYAREAGVRNLEKQLGRIARKAAVEIVRGRHETIRVGKSDLEHYLGKPVFRQDRLANGTGICTGLAWTSMGGVTLSVEADVVHHGGRGLKLTGQLGKVMQESANIAYDFVAAHLSELGGEGTFFDKAYVHLHVPEGATPKDGPSAGITMASALLSLARRQAPASGMAMTGELTLTGQVLPVGGIREKVIAARRSGIRKLVLSEANRGDIDELPEHLREGLGVYFARHYKDVAKHVFAGGGTR
jgi:ATP-dependent Lon protease